MHKRVVDPAGNRAAGLNPLEQQVVGFFTDAVRLLGLPKSIGEIYGLLFISQQPLSLDDLVGRLGISKGSASQGLRMLKSLGAVRQASAPANARRTYFEPDLALKQLVGGFIREQVRPHLQSGRTKLTALKQRAAAFDCEAERQFYQDRIDQLENWLRRAGIMLPVMQKLLGE